MSQPLRSTPVTPLDALRGLLGNFSEGSGDFEARLAQSLQDLRQQALPDLGDRLQRSTASRGLKRAILKQVQRFDWPDWTPLLLSALLQEQDLGVFDAGCAVLGQTCTTESVEALRKLQAARTDPERQLIVKRELETGASQHPKAYFFSRLDEGRVNPRQATQAARALAALVGEEDLPALAQVQQQEEEVVRRLGLRLLATLPGEAAGDHLLVALRLHGEEFEQLATLSGMLDRGREQSRGQAREELLRTLAARFGARAPEPVTTLNLEAAKEGGDPAPALQHLSSLAHGPLERYLVEACACLLEGKVARFAALQSETAELIQKRPHEVAAMADECAEVLAYRVARGLPPGREAVLAVLQQCYESRRVGDGLVLALARLVSPEDARGLDLLLTDPNRRRRIRALDVLGSREDDAFAPFFLRALEDSDAETDQVAIRHLGKLPSGFDRVMAMFRSGHAEQVRLAIHIFGEARNPLAGDPLLAYILEEGPDTLVVEAVAALGSIVHLPATAELLKMLHDGKPLNLQLALVAALGAMGTPEACLGLLERAPHLKAPKVLIRILEAALGAFPSFTRSFPVDRLPDLEGLVERCWDEREGEGHRVEAMFAVQNLFTFQREAYDRLQERFSDYLTEMRSAASWDRHLNERVSGLVKELGRRASNLSRLEELEGRLLGLLKGLPPSGPGRLTQLVQLRDGLRDPALLLREPIACRLADFVQEELGKTGKDWRELAHLCEIGGLSLQPRLTPIIQDTWFRAAGVGLKAAAKEALLGLGLTEEQIHRRPPILSVLLLEPSAFFRKRLAGALEARQIRVAGAGDRKEAQVLLEQAPVDLLVSESADATGDLRLWLEEQWQQRRCRQVLLATASRDLGDLLDAPWLLGAIHKPFQIEQLLQAIEP